MNGSSPIESWWCVNSFDDACYRTILELVVKPLIPQLRKKCDISWPINTGKYIDWTMCEIDGKDRQAFAVLMFDQAELVINAFTSNYSGPVVRSFHISDPEVHLKVIRYLEDLLSRYMEKE
jgi:hypothetical protein